MEDIMGVLEKEEAIMVMQDLIRQIFTNFRGEFVNIIAEAVQKATYPEWHGLYRIELTKERNGEQIDSLLPGDTIIVKKLTGSAILTIDTPTGESHEFDLEHFKMIKYPFQKVYLTNSAQSDAELVFLAGKGNIELDPYITVKKTIAFAYESITVSSSAVGFTSSVYKTSSHTAQVAFITCEDAQIRYRYDGTNPTASEGHILNSGDTLLIEGLTNIENFRAIRTGASDAKIRVTYEE